MLIELLQSEIDVIKHVMVHSEALIFVENEMNIVFKRR